MNAISKFVLAGAVLPALFGGSARAEQGSPQTNVAAPSQGPLESYQREADSGDAASQYQLGLLYKYGHRVKQDYFLSYFWIDLAMRNKTHPLDNATWLLANGEIGDIKSHLWNFQIDYLQDEIAQWRPGIPVVLHPPLLIAPVTSPR
jgi:TPR repeat protein